MKKLLFLILMTMSFLFTACSNNGEDLNVVQANYFNPPTWIQGTWKVSGTNTSYVTFTKDDYILLNPYTSYKNLMEQTASTGQTAKVDETINDNLYQFVITAGISSGTYKFTKVSNTKIECKTPNLPQPIYLDKL